MSREQNKPRKLTIFEFHSPKATDLEQQLKAIRSSSSLIKDRTELLTGSADETDPHYVRFINEWSDVNGFHGHALSYEPGKSPRFFNKDGLEKASISLENSMAQLDPEGKKEMVDAVIYFYVVGDYVLLAESRSFNRKDFERHLLVILQKKKLIEIEETISLQQCVVADQRDKLHRVKKIVVNAELLEKKVIEVPKMRGNSKRKERSFIVRKGIADFLKHLGGDGMSQLDITDAEKAGDISVRVEINIRRPSKGGSDVMTALSGGLAHVPQDNICLEVDGGTIKGKDLFLSKKVNVKHLDGVVVESELLEAMRSWFAQLADQKYFE